jgi:bifunctional UDP-N-acetylglucosamine pyrophosphorylase/glucosamine-1-phosphate N-acetyltransferase
MIDVLLLAGGESTRFWPFTDKNLTSFFGKSLLYWHYEQFVRIGCNRVVVVANKDSYEALKQVSVPKKLRVEYVIQSGAGQGHAVLSAKDALGKNPALILNASDIYDDELLKDIGNAYKKDPQNIHIAAVKVSTYFPGGYVKLNSENTIQEIIEKPKEGKEPSDIVRLVVDVIPNIEAFCSIVKTFGRYPADGYERALNKMIKSGTTARPLITATKWLYLKYPWHILSVMDMCLETIKDRHIDRSVKIGKFVTIEGPVIIEEGVKISEGTKIVGPVYIGKNTIIGNNNIIRYSHIGDGCITGFSTDITRSYIGNNCWFHTNYVGDSVIDSDVSMGSGTVLANLRLDETDIPSKVKEEQINTRRSKLGAMIGAGVRIGVNVSIMPGIKIGKKSFVGAGVVLGEDLKDGMYCRITPTVVVSENTKKMQVSREDFKKKL